LLHQPERRGRSLLSFSAGLDTTGSTAGIGEAAGGSEAGPSSRRTWVTGSRTVERRRERSAATVSGTTDAAIWGTGVWVGSGAVSARGSL
jgi:hypothetical protein